MCIPQHNTAALTLLVNAEKEDQIQNYFKAVTEERFCHLARHHTVWVGDDDDRVLGNEPNFVLGQHQFLTANPDLHFIHFIII